MPTRSISYRYSTLGSHALCCSCGNAEMSLDQKWVTFQAPETGSVRVVECRKCGWTDVALFNRRMRRETSVVE